MGWAQGLQEPRLKQGRDVVTFRSRVAGIGKLGGARQADDFSLFFRAAHTTPDFVEFVWYTLVVKVGVARFLKQHQDCIFVRRLTKFKKVNFKTFGVQKVKYANILFMGETSLRVPSPLLPSWTSLLTWARIFFLFFFSLGPEISQETEAEWLKQSRSILEVRTLVSSKLVWRNVRPPWDQTAESVPDGHLGAGERNSDPEKGDLNPQSLANYQKNKDLLIYFNLKKIWFLSNRACITSLRVSTAFSRVDRTTRDFASRRLFTLAK